MPGGVIDYESEEGLVWYDVLGEQIRDVLDATLSEYKGPFTYRWKVVGKGIANGSISGAIEVSDEFAFSDIVCEAVRDKLEDWMLQHRCNFEFQWEITPRDNQASS